MNNLCGKNYGTKNRISMSKYKLITFYRIKQPNWHMKCKRKYLQALKMGFRHIFKGHAVAFTIKNV